MTLYIGGQMYTNLFKKFLDSDGGVSGGTEGNNNATSAGTESTTTGERTFSQEDLNRIVVKEKEKAVSRALKNLGFEDSDSAKSKMEELLALEQDNTSVLEKATKAKDKAEKQAGEYKTKVEQLEQELFLLKSGALPDKSQEVSALLSVYQNAETTAEEALTKVKENFPNLFSDAETTTSGTGGSNNPPRDSRQVEESPFSGIGKRLAEEKLKQSGLLKEE